MASSFCIAQTIVGVLLVCQSKQIIYPNRSRIHLIAIRTLQAIPIPANKFVTTRLPFWTLLLQHTDRNGLHVYCSMLCKCFESTVMNTLVHLHNTYTLYGYVTYLGSSVFCRDLDGRLMRATLTELGIGNNNICLNIVRRRRKWWKDKDICQEGEFFVLTLALNG